MIFTVFNLYIHINIRYNPYLYSCPKYICILSNISYINIWTNSRQVVRLLLYHEANILNNVYACFCKNKLKLNLLKSKFICFNLSSNNVLHGHNLIVHSLKCNPNLNRCDPKCVKLEKVNELKYSDIFFFCVCVHTRSSRNTRNCGSIFNSST